MNANILVVDDEPEIAELVEVYLKSEGFSVVKCFTGTDALAALAHEQIDLAILDVMLPIFRALPCAVRSARIIISRCSCSRPRWRTWTRSPA